MKMNTDLSKFKRYAEEVVNGDRPSGLYQRQACQRYLDLFNREEIEFRPEKALEPVNLIQKLKLSGDRFEITDEMGSKRDFKAAGGMEG